jgi:hypothetical protein
MSDIISIEEPFTTPHSLETAENPKHGGGRPKDKVWQYFDYNATKHPGHYTARCKFCNDYWKVGVVKKLQAHLARDCESVGIEVKNKYMLIVARRDGLSENMEVEVDMNDENDNELSAEQTALIDRSVLKAFAMCGIPFQVVENPYFINMLKNIRSNYSPPSRERLSTNLLHEEAIRVDIKINNSLENQKNLTLGMDYILWLDFFLLNFF